MKKIVVVFDGASPEHEVSVITGIQVIEKIDRSLFVPFPVYMDKDGVFHLLKNFSNRNDFNINRKTSISFGSDKNGAYFRNNHFFGRKTYFECAYLALHGGVGESGQIQGFFETIGSPYTSPSVESSSIAMNKSLTKEVLASYRIKTVKSEGYLSSEIESGIESILNSTTIKLPVIVKPAHLGSSIGIGIARTKIELKKLLLSTSQVDTEVLIEKFLSPIKEYNISVRSVSSGTLEVSEIEMPLTNEQMLTFADKYQRGGKKSGGMANLNRQLPAQISSKLASEIRRIAIDAYRAIRAQGLIRIDFMVHNDEIFVTEVNPIPGSMSYYLWEATGIPFKDQITESINSSIKHHSEMRSKKINYKSDILEKFISSTNH